MKIFALALSAVPICATPLSDPATQICPSSACWTYADNKCTLIDSCVKVECNSGNMKLFAKTGVFGDGEFTGTGMLAGADGWYSKTCYLADGGNECGRPEIDDNGNLVFVEKVHQDGNDRTRSLTGPQNSKINLGGVTINTAPFGVGVDYTCSYPTTISVSSTEFAVNDVTISGTATGQGSLDGGFELAVGDPLIPIILGSMVDVTATWKILLSGFSFHFDQCVVKHAASPSVALIREGCSSATLDVIIGESESAGELTFQYKTFTVDGQETKLQTMECSLQICAGDGNCAKNAAMCPVTEHFGYH